MSSPSRVNDGASYVILMGIRRPNVLKSGSHIKKEAATKFIQALIDVVSC